MVELKAFRKVNKLLQKDVAEFLGVSREFVSMVESGKAQLPSAHLRKLRENGCGWDVSMLIAEDSFSVSGDHIQQNGGRGNIGKISDGAGELLALRKENEMLREKVDDLKRQNEKYWEALTKLMDK